MKKKELTVEVANPKTKEEYQKMIERINEYFKIKYFGGIKNEKVIKV